MSKQSERLIQVFVAFSEYLNFNRNRTKARNFQIVPKHFQKFLKFLKGKQQPQLISKEGAIRKQIVMKKNTYINKK